MKWGGDERRHGTPRRALPIAQAGDYRECSTFTLQATLVSLRTQMIVHGRSAAAVAYERAIRAELAHREEIENDQ